MPLFDIFWAMLGLFLFIAWFWLLIMIFANIFRSDMSGWSKALWTIFVIILPLLGVLIYLIANGDDMQRRSLEAASDAEQTQRAYIQSVAGGGSTSAADQLIKLGELKDKGAITDEEFAAQKAKLLG